MSVGTYKYNAEYRSDIKEDAVKRVIVTAEEAFQRLYSKWNSLIDLEMPEQISSVYEDAVKEGLFDLASETREIIFGRDIHFYGVCYLWDHCVNYCCYCPNSVENRRKSGFTNREMTVEQAIEDTKAILLDGHSHICYLAGEDPIGHPVTRLAEHLEAIDQLGLSEIILNVGPQTFEDFRTLRAAAKTTSLQFRVFQETYDRNTYSGVHTKGHKRNYDFRYGSQERAMLAGFDNVGLGVLFGLHRYPLEEIQHLRTHAQRIMDIHGVIPARVCLPSVSEVEGLVSEAPYKTPKGEYGESGIIITKDAYEMLNEMLFALAKCAMPLVGLVSSERDEPGMLEILDRYASCTTLNVHPGVGDNTSYHAGTEDTTVHFQQANSYSRSPIQTIRKMRLAGFNPVLNHPSE